MNFKIAEKALKYLEKEPSRFDMGLYIATPYESTLLGNGEPSCGTVCCFAGAVVLSNLKKKPGSKELFSMTFYQSIEGRAKALLEIGNREAGEIFHSELWPAEFRHKYYGAETQRQRVKALRAYIESLKS